MTTLSHPQDAANRIGLALPLAAVFMRFGFIMLGNGLAWLIFSAQGHPTPWNQALLWGNVHVTLVADPLTIAFLLWAVRREGLTLRDLVGFGQSPLIKDVLLGLGITVLLAITLFVGNLIGALVAFGPAVFTQPVAPLDAALLPPLGYYLWALIVLPVTVGITEELAYRGYAQPRLEAATGSRWLGLLIMAFGFGVQHIAFSMTDWQSALARFVGTFIAGIVFGLIYMKQRRLLPLIIGHWLVNAVFLGLFPLLGYLMTVG